jgi:hypothetical protein
MAYAEAICPSVGRGVPPGSLGKSGVSRKSLAGSYQSVENDA